MAFDFDKAEKEAAKLIDNTKLGAIVLGSSGGGKSFALGTLPGKILYLYTGSENHGVDSARISASKIVPVQIDLDGAASDEQKLPNGMLKPDAAYKRLLSILGEVEGIKKAGFGSVVIDGATELESIITATEQWKLMCQTDKGKHNPYAESKSTVAMFRPIVSALHNLQTQLGTHFAMTCILDVKSAGVYGEIEEASPRLSGYSVAESLIQQFGDVIVVGRMSKDNVAKHKFQFMTDVTRVSKDVLGNVKKAINFAPRVRGVPLERLPTYLDPDFKKVLELKTK